MSLWSVRTRKAKMYDFTQDAALNKENESTLSLMVSRTKQKCNSKVRSTVNWSISGIHRATGSGTGSHKKKKKIKIPFGVSKKFPVQRAG